MRGCQRAAESELSLGRGRHSLALRLSSAQVDAVFICSPDRAHLEPVLAAAVAGKHVFVEKPLATSSEEGLQMVEAAEEAGIVFMVGHVLRFDPRYIHARNAVAAGDVGEVIRYVRPAQHLYRPGAALCQLDDGAVVLGHPRHRCLDVDLWQPHR